MWFVFVCWITSKTPLSATLPNQNYGFGRVTLDAALPLKGVTDQTFALLGDFGNMKVLQQGDVQTYTLTLIEVSVQMPLKITLVWHDPAAAPLASKALINNLDLVVKVCDLC